MAVYEFEGMCPIIGNDTFVHPLAAVIGDVQLGERCFIGAGAVIRGDSGPIIIGSGTSIQDNCSIHSDNNKTAIIEGNSLIGHGAIIHGPCLIQQNVTIGMGSIVSIGCEIQNDSLLAAGSVLPPGHTIPQGKIALGNPARVVRDLDESNRQFNRRGVKLYQELAMRCNNSLKLVD
ncbi:MAG: gamma carbonic anhydrase family protein [Syntrophomonadaceae bacterium]|jgi:carbonic anhydrase/acetyltransferase-like protein (isoleucine patch superfamily)